MAIQRKELEVNEELMLWGHRVFNRIKENFTRFQINKEPGRRYTGQLYRSIYWQVFNMAAGDVNRVDFFYEYYGKFVELGVGKGFAKVDIPPMKSLGPVKIPRRNRMSKPFFYREVKYHTDWLQDRMSYVYETNSATVMLRGINEGIKESGSSMKGVVTENKDDKR